MVPVTERKCSHPGCPCPADPKSEYCNDKCRDAAASHAEAGCPCGHALCTQAQEASQTRKNPKDEVSGSYDPRTARKDVERPLTDDWGAGDKH
jgi:hypothetical protein